MSFRTWKKEFYPVKAKTIAKKGSEVEIIQHSLTKWIGLRPKNMKKHGLRRRGNSITDISEESHYQEISEGKWPYTENKTQLSINDESCSLCQRYQDKLDRYVDNSCETCPLYLVRKNHACTTRWFPGEDDHPYATFTTKNNPEPMIADLRRALQRAKRRAKKEQSNAETKQTG